MDKLILTVNEYPWTSFWVFLGMYLILSLIVKVAEIVFLKPKSTAVEDAICRYRQSGENPITEAMRKSTENSNNTNP